MEKRKGVRCVTRATRSRSELLLAARAAGRDMELVICEICEICEGPPAGAFLYTEAVPGADVYR